MSVDKLERKIISFIDNHRKDLNELLQKLVRINTVNPYCGDSDVRPGEEEGQLFFMKEMEKTGFRTKLTPIPDDVFKDVGMITPSGRVYGNRKNLQGELNFSNNGYAIVLNGHMDTVGIDGMTIDPFSGEYKDGKIFGRGSSDDKSGLAGALIAVKALNTVSHELSGKIIFQSVADEECSGAGSGTLALCKNGLSADMAIVVDGSDLVIETSSLGTMTFDVEVFGKSGHASESKGVSAIEKALFLKEAVDEFIRERKIKAPERNINLGVFHGGTSPSMIPGYAKFSVNVDYSIQDAKEAVVSTKKWGGSLIRKRFEELIFYKASQDDYLKRNPPVVTCVKDLYPFICNADSPVINALTETFKDYKHEGPVVKEGLWCDAAHLNNTAGIPAVVFGPLAEGKPHTADEFVEISAVIDFTKILALTLFRILRKKGSNLEAGR